MLAIRAMLIACIVTELTAYGINRLHYLPA